MRKAVLSASLIAAGLLAAGALQAQTLVTPAYTYTTVTTSPVFVSNGPDIPAGPDYPYEYPGRSKVVMPAPALITSPVVTTTYYTPQPLLTLATPVASTTTVTSSTAVMGGASETSNVPMRAGEASTMTQGAPNLVTSNDQTFRIVSASPIVVYSY
jgi:hypothetical protein